MQKAAKCLREEMALPVPKKLRHQSEQNWRNWSSEQKASALQLLKTARYNDLALKHGKDSPPKQTIWNWANCKKPKSIHLCTEWADHNH